LICYYSHHYSVVINCFFVCLVYVSFFHLLVLAS
jgi:hypothetical protein